jgi:hypothetical protein
VFIAALFVKRRRMIKEDDPKARDRNDLSDEFALAPFGCDDCDGTYEFDGWEFVCKCSGHACKPNFQPAKIS